MKTVKSLLASAIVCSSLVMLGCNSTNVQQNAKYEAPATISATSPALIFPVSLHGVPGNSQEVGLAITGGVATKYGTSVISAQQLYPAVGNLSWTLGESMRRNVQNGEYSLKGGSSNKVADDLAFAMEKLTSSLKSANVVSDKNFNFEHVIVLHIDSSGGIAVPGVNRVTAFGGLVNTKTQEVVTYIEKDLVLANDADAILAQMPVEMNNLVAELVTHKL